MTNSYKRWIGGVKSTDLETGKQLYTKTLIIQRVTMIPTYDYKGHVIITTIGDGKAIIMRDGHIIPATWRKKSRTDRTMFYDEQGNILPFNRGLIWIEAVPNEQGRVSFIINK
jgi:hypothetical protein